MSLNLIPPITVFDNVDISTSQTSTPVHIMYTDNIGIQFVWTGTPTGTFAVQVSNTAILSPTGSISGGTWTTLSGISASATGSSGDGYFDINQSSAAFIRATYTATMGDGNCTATLTGKPV